MQRNLEVFRGFFKSRYLELFPPLLDAICLINLKKEKFGNFIVYERSYFWLIGNLALISEFSKMGKKRGEKN